MWQTLKPFSANTQDYNESLLSINFLKSNIKRDEKGMYA